MTNPEQMPIKGRNWVPIGLGAAICAILLVGGIGLYLVVATIRAPSPNPQPAPAAPPSQASVPMVAPPVFAATVCNPPAASFYEDFHKVDPGWDFAQDDTVHYTDGQMVMKALPNGGVSIRYLPILYDNATICTHLKSPPQVKALDGGASAGLIFWGINADNYYMAQVMPDGAFGIYRKIGGNFVDVVSRSKSDQVKKDLNAINEIKVALVNNRGTLFVNDVKVADFKGQPPKGGGAVGVRAESETGMPDEWRFLALAVKDNGKSPPITLPPSPSGPTVADCRIVNPTDFQDTFATADPGWSFDDVASHYADGQLVLKPKADGSYTQLYRPMVFKNATLCLTFKSPVDMADPEDALSGGAAFWGNDYANFYALSVYPNGTFDVYRKVNKTWVGVVPRTPSDAIKKGPGAVNKLQIVLKDTLATLYINGALVNEFHGQPPKEGAATGVFSQSEKSQSDEWRFLNITVIENQ